MAKSLDTMRAREVMTTSVAYVMDETPIQEVARLMLDEGISAVPVLDEAGHLVGIVSEGDLVRRRSGVSTRRRSWWLDLFEVDTRHNQEFLSYLQHHGLRARDLMTHGVVVVNGDASISLIAELLERHQIKRVPVLSAGKMIGIVSRADLLKAISKASPVQHRPPPHPRAVMDEPRSDAGDDIPTNGNAEEISVPIRELFEALTALGNHLEAAKQASSIQSDQARRPLVMALERSSEQFQRSVEAARAEGRWLQE